jgi:hypothetical protein
MDHLHAGQKRRIFSPVLSVVHGPVQIVQDGKQRPEKVFVAEFQVVGLFLLHSFLKFSISALSLSHLSKYSEDSWSFPQVGLEAFPEGALFPSSRAPSAADFSWFPPRSSPLWNFRPYSISCGDPSFQN